MTVNIAPKCAGCGCGIKRHEIESPYPCYDCKCLGFVYVKGTASTLNGQWPSDTWFRRAMARKLKAVAAELETSNAQLPKVQS